MIEAIRKIGVPLAKASLEDQSEALIESVKSGEEKRVAIIDFDLKSSDIHLDIEPLTEEHVKKYFHIGTADGPSSLQWMLTSTRPDYIISQSIPSLIKKINNPDFQNILNKVLDTFYYDYGKQSGSRDRYRYILNIEKYFNLKPMDQLLVDANNDVKNVVQRAAKEFTDYIAKKWEVRAKDIVLWAVTINKEVIQERGEYRNLAWQLKEAHYEKAKEGICHLCNNKGQVSSDTGKLKLNYYITQKVNFASNLKDFAKNMGLCKACHKELILGEIYALKKLNASIGKMRFLVFPEYLIGESNKWDIKDIQQSYDEAYSIINFKDMARRNVEAMKELKREQKDQYTFHYLFYMKQQQEFRVLQMTKDVSPTRIGEIQRNINDCDGFGRIWFNWENAEKVDNWNIDMAQIYYLFPIHEGDRGIAEHRRLLKLYDAMLTKRQVPQEIIIEKLLELARAYYLEQTSAYQISKPNNKEIAMIYGLLKGMLLMKLLKGLSVIRGEGGAGMDESMLKINNKLKQFAREMEYTEQQMAMVLLGILIYKIGREQEKEKLTSRPILNKINYRGMNLIKIRRLGNEVFEKLKQYKLLNNPQQTYEIKNILEDFTILMDKNQNRWNLSNEENVYYILSGYALGTRPIYVSDKDKDKKDSN